MGWVGSGHTKLTHGQLWYGQKSAEAGDLLLQRDTLKTAKKTEFCQLSIMDSSNAIYKVTGGKGKGVWSNL